MLIRHQWVISFRIICQCCGISISMRIFLLSGSIIQDSIGVCCNTGCKGFDRARKVHGGRYNNEMVDGVISVLRILPIFLLIILYWAIYSQVWNIVESGVKHHNNIHMYYYLFKANKIRLDDVDRHEASTVHINRTENKI